MANTRSKTLEIRNAKNDEIAHFVYCIANNRNMKQQAEQWVDCRRIQGDKYNLLIQRQDAPLFGKIKSDEVLHIYGHGEEKKSVLYRGNDALSPSDFLDFLIKNKLSSEHQILEIDACYSDKFVQELAMLAKNDFPNLCVSGFPEQFALCQGPNTENLANLKKPFVIERDGAWEINKKLFTQYQVETNVDKRLEFLAENHKVTYFSNPKEENASSSTNTRLPVTAQSIQTSPPPLSYAARSSSSSDGTASYINYHSPSRGELFGRKSWSEILNKDNEIDNKVELNSNETSSISMNAEDNLTTNKEKHPETVAISHNISELDLSMKNNENNDTITLDQSALSRTCRR